MLMLLAGYGIVAILLTLYLGTFAFEVAEEADIPKRTMMKTVAVAGLLWPLYLIVCIWIGSAVLLGKILKKIPK